LHVVYQAIGPNDQHGNPTNEIWVAATSGSGAVQILPGSCTDVQCEHSYFANWAGDDELVLAGDRQEPSDNSLHPALWTMPSNGSTVPTEIQGSEVSPTYVIGVNGSPVDPQGSTIVTTGGA